MSRDLFVHPSPIRPMSSLVAVPLLVLLGIGVAAAAKKPPAMPAPPPPAMPAQDDPASLYASLSDAQRATLDEERRLVTFDERETDAGDHVELLAVSLGVLSLPPQAVRAVLEDVSDYPTWLTLQPSYKSVRVDGAARVSCEVGNADARHGKRTIVYSVSSEGPVTTWLVLNSGSPLQPGTYLKFEVVPHPRIPDASLVVHRQFGLLPRSGRMTHYLTSEDDDGKNQWWKDSNRHARRLHWAFDAAARHPPGRDRKNAYVEDYQRDFHGKIPWWANP